MNTTNSDDLDERLEKATAERLAKLRTMPVDTSRLADRLRAQIPQMPQAQTAATRHSRFLLFRPLRAAAAGLLLLGIILAAVISSSGGPAMASAADLAQVHQDLTSGKGHLMKVSSIEAARAALNGEWPKGPALPDVPDDHVMACCVHEVGRKKMACVSLVLDSVPVTMAVADSAEVKVPQGTTRAYRGVTYHVESAQGVNMAMSQQSGRWVCLMGRLPVDRLLELASELQP